MDWFDENCAINHKRFLYFSGLVSNTHKCHGVIRTPEQRWTCSCAIKRTLLPINIQSCGVVGVLMHTHQHIFFWVRRSIWYTWRLSICDDENVRQDGLGIEKDWWSWMNDGLAQSIWMNGLILIGKSFNFNERSRLVVFAGFTIALCVRPGKTISASMSSRVQRRRQQKWWNSF